MSDFEQRMLGTFASVAGSLGYSDTHGRIMAALLIAESPLSLQDLSKKTGYSLASISLSLDLLELLGLVRKIKNPQDRKLYVKLDGDVIAGLKNALLFKVQKQIATTLTEFESYKTDKKSRYKVSILEREIKRLEQYIDSLSEIDVPKN